MQFEGDSESTRGYLGWLSFSGLPIGQSQPGRCLNITQDTKSSKQEGNTWIEALKATNLFSSSCKSLHYRKTIIQNAWMDRNLWPTLQRAAGPARALASDRKSEKRKENIWIGALKTKPIRTALKFLKNRKIIYMNHPSIRYFGFLWCRHLVLWRPWL